MRIRWYGQSAFLLSGPQSMMIDPFGPKMRELAVSRGLVFGYPPIEPLETDLLLITHEHADHNAAELVRASTVIRSTAGTLDSPVGEVVAVASEHDEVAGTARGPNTIFRFALDGLSICHLGDFGQAALRPEQQQALGAIDVLFVPAGSGPTVGGESAARLVRELRPRLVVPMHYRTEAVNFLDPPDAFLDALDSPVEHAGEPEFDPEPLLGSRDRPTVVLLPPPL